MGSDCRPLYATEIRCHKMWGVIRIGSRSVVPGASERTCQDEKPAKWPNGDVLNLGTRIHAIRVMYKHKSGGMDRRGNPEAVETRVRQFGDYWCHSRDNNAAPKIFSSTQQHSTCLTECVCRVSLQKSPEWAAQGPAFVSKAILPNPKPCLVVPVSTWWDLVACSK